MSRSRVRVSLSADLIYSVEGDFVTLSLAIGLLQYKIMIKSEIIKMPYSSDNTEIEEYMRKQGIEPLRWAIVKVENGILEISVSYFMKNVGSSPSLVLYCIWNLRFILFSNMIDNHRYCGIVLMGDGNERL